MPDASYVREYFDRHADEWLDAAYLEGQLPLKFPIGEERLRVALEAVAPRAGANGLVVDLGCGGGQLCAHAAALGLRARGIDVAPGMIDAAEELRRTLPAEQSERIELCVAGFDESGLAAGSADAVTAMGLIEYLPDDGPLLAEAARLLRPGGRFAVSCRNRLYNVQSANEFTQAEVADGHADALLNELAGELGRVTPETARRLGEEVAAAAEALADAAAADADDPPVPIFEHKVEFEQVRRQHTPDGLRRAAAGAGLEFVAVAGVHPHPLPPALERLAPRTFNVLALAYQRALETSPLSLAFCSTFIGVFERV
jgi:SAM-dependent methyltransferase